MEENNKREKIAAAKKKLKQFQNSGRARSVSRTRESSDREVQREPFEKLSRTSSPQPILPSNTSRRQSDDISAHRLDNDNRTTASTESLQQLSRQINGLLSEARNKPHSTSLESAVNINWEEAAKSGLQELEERNRDLAALLEKHAQANEQLSSQNQQLRAHSKSLQEQLEAERNSFHEKHKKDIGSLKEQLQVHIQTIGILVAEKTELQSQVNQVQRIADQRIEEIEELSGRLKASRQRVSDLERTLSTSSQSSHQLEKTAAESAKEVDRLKLELFKSNKQSEELKQQISELKQQLQTKVSENGSLNHSVEDLQKRLEMAELYAQQLSSETENSQGSVEVLNNLQKERDSLLERLHQHEDLTQQLKLERDQVTEQYQRYTEQLCHQAQQLTQQITVLTEEREQLLNTQHQLEGTITELQKKLEDVSIPAAPLVTQTVPKELTEELDKLRSHVREATDALESQVRDNMQLSRLLEEKEDKISSLERSLEELGEQAGDKAQLLESIQSDKTALSRAMTQNKELKSQLAELQQGFVKMSQDNMELVTKLQTEQHSVNELSAKLAQQEDEITQLRATLSHKEQSISELSQATQAAEIEKYQQSQMSDRLRHYEAQAQLVDTLQNELTSAQDMMEALTTQNSELRTMLIKATEVKSVSNLKQENGEESAANPRDEIIQSLQDTIRQLENERAQLYDSLKEQRALSDNLGIKIADLNEELIKTRTDNLDSDKISRGEYNELKNAMEMIQQKYMHVMKDKADLSDKADQLEHLVLQLQGETDTIGEYISLYHHQRALLQQRESQKNDYISQLARDREQLQDKLGELQALVMQLLGERNMLHSYNQETKLSPQKQQPQHQQPQKHQQAMSNGTLNSYNNDWPDYTSSESDTESEVEPIVGGQQRASTPDSEPSQLSLGSPEESALHPAHRSNVYNGHTREETDGGYSPDDEDNDMHQGQHLHHHHHHSHHHHQHTPPSFRLPPEEDKTAHKILTLLTELGHSHMVEQIPLIDRNFLPCKFCKGAVQIV
ncbi:golgin subfamily A member 2 [Biomphalaria glabrata]|uniref:Golgin subfamily A member 2-like isoform X1 n=1 Tax=Biomphalaria glabrata TaxID=6526 RepID=A0A9W3BAN1_BIOGL|nr:golgin subfamily A member 2-like isoform X1 [Biomphalaria glabrata]KAI8729343.1 golgin subfamily A member 2-like; partial [Biomphalaria glabrata]